MRSQHENRRVRIIFSAAERREERLFRLRAAQLTLPIHRSRDGVDGSCSIGVAMRHSAVVMNC